MRHSLIAALAFTPIIILCGGAVYLAAYSLPGWGWFLLVACFVGGSYSYNDKGKS